MFRIGTAPVSWGVDREFPLPPEVVFAEIARAGYEGTETGPPGYLPADPQLLAELLDEHGLLLASSYVPFGLHLQDLPDEELAYFRRVVTTLRDARAGVVLVADRGTPERMAHAGRVTPDMGLPSFDRVRDHLALLCDLAGDLQVAFHPHVGTYVETRDEIARLMDAVEGLPVGLCPDTGHLAYGGSDPVEVFRTYAERVRHVHLKDLRRARLQGLGFHEAVAAGVFVPLGQGDVDNSAILEALRDAGYTGWIIVEQDRLLTPESDPLGDARASRAWLHEWTRRQLPS